MRRENAGKVLSYSWCVSRGEESRLRTANRARWHLITKGKHKEAPQPAAGLLEGRVGVIQRVHETNTNHFHTFIHNKSSHLLLRLLRLLWCHKFDWTINYWQKILLYIKYKPHIGILKWSDSCGTCKHILLITLYIVGYFWPHCLYYSAMQVREYIKMNTVHLCITSLISTLTLL